MTILPRPRQADRNAGDQADLGVDWLDASVGQAVLDRGDVLTPTQAVDTTVAEEVNEPELQALTS